MIGQLRDKLGVVSYHGIEVLSRLVDAGVKHFRLSDAAWHICEPKPGEYRFEHLDAAVKFLLDNGCVPFLSLYGPPCWLDPEGKIERVENISSTECAIKFQEERHIPKWYVYLEKIFSRYRLSHWGIQCEINLPGGWWIGTEKEFANNVLRPARDIAHQYGRYIVAPGITIQPETKSNLLRAINSFQELRKVARDVSRKYIDHLDFHVYYDKAPEKMVQSIILWMKQFKRYSEDPKQLKSGHYSNKLWEWWPTKKLFITEIGFDMRSVGSFSAGEEGQKLKFEPLIEWLASEDIYSQWIQLAYIYRGWDSKGGNALLRPDYSPTATLKYVSEFLK